MVSRLALLVCLLAAVVYSGNAYWQTRAANNAKQMTDVAAVAAMGLVDLPPKHLAAGFTDVNGTLLADPPGDASKFGGKFEDPAALVIGHLAEADPDSPMVDWAQFDKHLAEVTGRAVSDVEVENGPSQIDKIRAGAINIMALHGPDVPFLVNNCGYHPVGVLGDEGGFSGNRYDLLVPANSPLKHPADLRGHTLTCSGPLSIVGYRAAIVLLMQNQQLRPNVDYFINWSLGQKQSIKGIADGTYEAAAVSDDKLHSMLDKGSINDSAYHVIDQSDVFPRMAVGYFYNLKPELASKVQQAVLSYKPAASADDEKPLHFVPVDYKKDFALVREIDDRFDPRLEPKAKHEEPSTMPVGQ